MSTTPDGRQWLTSNNIAERLINAFLLEYPQFESQLDKPIAQDIIRIAYENTNYTMEFKILRLTEKLKDRILDGTITDYEEIKQAFTDIYTTSILALYDDEGNLL